MINGQDCLYMRGADMEENNKTVLTAESYKALEDELDFLKSSKRKEIAEAIKEARAQGDLSENAEYQAAKDEQRKMEARIEELEKLLTNVEIIEEDENESKDVVRLGSKVRVLDVEFKEELEYRIVGSNEANTDAGKISNESPLGKALIGSKVGKTVSVNAPMGVIKYKILKLL